MCRLRALSQRGLSLVLTENTGRSYVTLNLQPLQRAAYLAHTQTRTPKCAQGERRRGTRIVRLQRDILHLLSTAPCEQKAAHPGSRGWRCFALSGVTASTWWLFFFFSVWRFWTNICFKFLNKVRNVLLVRVMSKIGVRFRSLTGVFFWFQYK